MNKIKICVAGLGNVGSNVIKLIEENNNFFSNKNEVILEIIGISAKSKNKKRIFNMQKYNWHENPLDLIKDSNCQILIELIGHEKGTSYDLIKAALMKKIHVVTANKALLAKYGNELFAIAEKNNVSLMYEAAVAAGIPIIKTIKNSLSFDKVISVSGILNGTTNFILSEMYKNDSNFKESLVKAQELGFAESDPKNDIEGIDAAHKISILSCICFGIKFDFSNVFYKGISKINSEDIKYSKKIGYKIKLVAYSEITNNSIFNIVEPILVKNNSKLANVNGVLNGIKIKTRFLEDIFFEGPGAGGPATAGSIISDIYEIIKNPNADNLGFKINKLKEIKKIDYSEIVNSFYIRINVKDLPGVLAKITSNLNSEGISIETILQLPKNNSLKNNNEVSIIITTHETKAKLLNEVISKIEKFDFVVSDIVTLSIDKSVN